MIQIRVAGRTDSGTQKRRWTSSTACATATCPPRASPRGTEPLVTGAPAFGVDFIDKAYGAFPWLVLAVLVVSYLILLRAFRSVVLPLKAVLMNLLSVGAAYGVLVLVFQHGWGEPIGLQQSPQIEAWIPIFLFAVLFGLSMDYEVFLLSRVREEWERRHDNEAAVAYGLEHTGRIITAAAIIMIAAFAGFSAGSFVGLQEFGIGLSAAIFLDATVVRAILVPATMKLLGKWNWYMPERVRRALRLAPAAEPVIRSAGEERIRAMTTLQVTEAGRRRRDPEDRLRTPAVSSIEFDVIGRARGLIAQPHVHTQQTERHEVIDGSMRLIIDGREHLLRHGREHDRAGWARRTASSPAEPARAACASSCAPRATARRSCTGSPRWTSTASATRAPVAAAELVRDFGATGHAAKPSLRVQRTLSKRSSGLASREYLFVDEWDVDAPREAVFDAIADARSYPRVVEARLHRRRGRRRAGARQGVAPALQGPAALPPAHALADRASSSRRT